MNIELQPKFHNRFDIYKKNIITDIEEQVAYAENIILNAMFTRLCNREGIFETIAYGTGTGVLDKARTTLFSYLGYKTAVDVENIRAYPTCSRRRSITLGLTDHVGSVLTEVGIGYVTGSINTHAMLRDMNGNPVSITKTGQDILTIYATLYMTLENSHPTLKLISPNNSSNALINYFFGSGIGSLSVTAGEIGDVVELPNGLLGRSLGTASTAGTLSGDAPNKRWLLSTPRFGVNDANGHIAEINFGNIARLALPASGIYAGLDLTGISVGTGDGVKTRFVLPSRNVRQSTINTKINGVSTSARTISTLLNQPAVMGLIGGSASSGAASLSDNAEVLAFGTPSVLPYFETFSLINREYVKRPAPVEVPTTGGLNQPNTALSGDGNTLAIYSAVGNGVTLYRWNGSAWIKIGSPSALASIYTGKIVFNYDGTIMAHSDYGGGTPIIRIFIWDTNTSTWSARGSSISAGVGSYGVGLWMNSTGNILIFSGYGIGIKIYTWNGSAWANRGDTFPNIPTLNNVSKVIMANQDVTRLICGYVGSGVNSALLVYDYIDNAWVKRPNPSSACITSDYGVGLTPDGLIAVLMTNASPYLELYRWENNAWTKISNPSSAPTLMTGGCMSANGEYMISSTNGQAAYCLNLLPKSTLITFDTPPAVGDAITADYTVDGIHKTTTRVIDVTFTIQFGEPA